MMKIKTLLRLLKKWIRQTTLVYHTLEINSLEKVRPGIKPLFFSQKMAAKLPLKKIPSTAAKATSMATKETKPKAPAAHPTYLAMITAAIPALKERTGSSRQAILKYIVANYKVDAAKAVVATRLALKAGVAKGVIKNAKETGKGAGKFKVVKVEKSKKAAAKKPVVKMTVERK